MSQIKVANFSIGQFFKSASMFTPTSSIVTISAISSGSITFTPALSNYTTIRSASLSWLDSSSLSPFYSITGGGSFQSIDSTAFSFLFSFGSTTTIVTQSNSSFIFNSSSIVGASTRQFSISYLTQSIQSYYDDTVEEAYVQLTIDTTNNENSIKFDTGLFNSTTGEVEFTSNTPVKGGIGTSARGIGSFAMGSGSIAQESASVAEGINTLASGFASHAAGINTTASGQAAFSMGIETDADGMASFAAGSGSWARGAATVAMGIGTIASASGQVTIGHFNFPLNSPDHLFVVGGGTSGTPSGRGNLLEVYGGVGSTYKAVKIDVGSTFTKTSAPSPGLSIYGNTTFNGNVTGSNFNAIGNDITIQVPGFTITTGSFTSNFYRRQAVFGGGPEDFEDVLKASAGFDHRGFNFSLSEQTTAPGSTFLWTNSSNRLFYSSSAVILNDGNTLGSTMTIGTNDTNNLQLETNNTTRIFISSSGNVGIGTTTPTNTFEVNGGVTATSITASIISASSGITASQYSGVPTFTYNDNNFQSVNIINTSNTSNALNGLTIYSASNASVGQFLYLNPIYANSALRDTVLFNSVGDRKLGFVANTTTAAGANSDIYFQAGSTTAGRMIYISGQAGAMGIGMGASTPTSTNRLQVRGQGATSSTTALRVENSSAAARLTILDDGTSAFNTSHLYISSSGNVGIGTNLPSAELHISGASTDNLLRIGSPTNANILFVSGSGNVGIGTNLPSADLHISGASADTLLRVGSPSNDNILFVTGSGRVGINTTSSTSFLGGNISTFTIFQNSGSGDGLTPSTGLQIVNSGSSTSAQAQLSIVTVGDKFAAFNIGTSGSGTQNNYWHLSKRNAAASHSLNLYNNNQGSFSSPLFSFISAGTSTLGENNQIQIDGANGRVGLQVTPSDTIHLHSEPGGGHYINIDATQTSNPPPLTAASAKTGYGITTNSYYLAEPDYWMEIKLDGVIVLVPCYLPA